MAAFLAFARRDFPDVGPFVVHSDSDLCWTTTVGSEPALLQAYLSAMSKPTTFDRSPPYT
jgi:hypothetical protein